MPKPGTAARSLLIFFLALELSAAGFALSVQTDQSFALSYGFGSPNALLLLDSSYGLSLSQTLGAKVFGEITNDFYISAMVDEQSAGYLTLTYVPSDLRFGSVRSVGPGLRSFSLFGFSTPYLSFGQVLGNIVRTVFTLSAADPTVYLGTIMYGSVRVYVDGKLLPQSDYTVNYDDGTITFTNFFTAEPVTVEYQSATGAYSPYMGTLESKTKIGDFDIESYECTVLSSPSSQYFVKAVVSPMNSDSSFSAALNVDGSPSVQVENNSSFALGDGKVDSSFSFTSEGFREPLGIVRPQGFSGSVGFENDFGRIAAAFDPEELRVSAGASGNDFEFKIGKSPYLGINYKNDWLRLGFTSDSSGVRAFESVDNGNLSVLSEQDLLERKVGINLTLATPVTVAASMDSNGIGISVSKDLFPFTYTMGLNGSFSDPFGTVDAGAVARTFWSNSELCWGAKVTVSTNATFVVAGNMEIDLPNSDVWNLTLTSLPEAELSFSNDSLTFDAKFGNYGAVLTASAGFEMWNLNFQGTFSLAAVKSDLGGTFGIKVWRDDY